ncbi:Methylmalonyl-CoA epimerase [Diplonema papillatum]|nr:Methylmalonyl-CoA epimerase [Diplonema papillatum]|eukprot:gene7047-10866_t
MLRGVARAGRRCFATAAHDLPIQGRFNHVAIAVPKEKCIKEAAAVYGGLFGARVSDPVDLPEHGVTTVFVELPNTKLEFLHPLGDASPIAGFFKKNPMGGIHHMCIEVEDIEKSIEEAKAKGLIPLGEKPKIGAHGKPVMFFHPKSTSGILLEVEQA